MSKIYEDDKQFLSKLLQETVLKPDNENKPNILLDLITVNKQDEIILRNISNGVYGKESKELMKSMCSKSRKFKIKIYKKKSSK